MGKMKLNPRYNVVSIRVSDSELAKIKEIMDTRKLGKADAARIYFKAEA